MLQRLWLMFRHDLSGLEGELPAADGTFRRDRLDAALSDEADWKVYLLQREGRPAGLALIRG